MYADNVQWLSGTVTDSISGHVIEFVNVTVYAGDSKAVAFGASGHDGSFAIRIPAAGKYKVGITCIGYESQTKVIDCPEGGVDLGTIVLKKSLEQIAAASVSAKQILSREPDRIVYNVSADPDAARMNMAEFMSKIPGLERSQGSGKLTFREKPLASILIDDRVDGMINARRQYPMAFIKADYISKLELILPDSPEYNNKEAMLVIRLKEPLPFGAAAELRAEGGTDGSVKASPDIVINTPVVGIGLQYGFSWSHVPELINSTIRADAVDSRKVMTSDRTLSSISRSHKLGMDLFRYFLNNKLNINLSFQTRLDSNDSRSATLTRKLEGNGYNSYQNSSISSSYSPPRFNAGLSVSYSWKRGNNLSVSNTFRSSDNSSDEQLITGVTTNRNSSDSKQYENNFSASLTIKDQCKGYAKWSSATKIGFMFRNYENADTYHDGTAGGMAYRQGVAYLNENFSGNLFKRKLMYSLGANLEYIRNRGSNLRDASSLDYDDFNITPSVALSYRPDIKSIYNLRYSMRTSRPRASQLDPYMDRSNPDETIIGNPNLKGQMTHAIAGSYKYSPRSKVLSELSFSGRWSFTPNVIERYSFVDGEGMKITTFGNLSRSDLAGITLGALLKPFKMGSLDISASVDRISYTLPEVNNSYWRFTGREQFFARFKWFNVIQLFSIEPFNAHSQTHGYKLDPYLAIGIMKSWPRINLGGELSFNDLLHGSRGIETITSYGDYIERTRIGRIGRSVSLSIHWQIGKFKNHASVQHSSYDME